MSVLGTTHTAASDSAISTPALGDQRFSFSFNSDPIVTLFPDGRVEYSCAPDEAARVFWDAVKQQHPAFRGWQPIETAPRDHTSILIWDGKKMATAFWSQWTHAGYWVADGAVGPECENEFDDPTHWQPLPEPPSTEPASAKSD
jgi:hypothetical protein